MMRRSLALFHISLFLLVIGSSSLLAQFDGVFNDQKFQSSIPITKLTTVPPIEKEMPEVCQAGYQIMENVSKNASCEYFFDKLKYAPLDTIKYYAGFIYEMLDYSPVLFRRYSNTVSDLQSEMHSYRSNPSCLYLGTMSAIQNQYFNVIGKDLTYILLSHYILHVRIDSVRIINDTTGTLITNWVNVSSTVLNKLKGKILPDNCKFQSGDKPMNTFNCLNFGYLENWETGTGLSGTNLPLGKIRTVQKGEEYIVFLKHVSGGSDVDILTTELRLESSGGLFKIDNGIVFDPDNFWLNGIKSDISLFLSSIDHRIHKIQSWHKYISSIIEAGTDEFNVTFPNDNNNSGISALIANPSQQPISLSIYDLSGRLQYSYASGSNSVSMDIVQIPITTLANGMYLYSIKSGSQFLSGLIPIVK